MDRGGNIISIPEGQPVPEGFAPISEREKELLEKVEQAERKRVLEQLRAAAPFCNARGPKRLKCRRKAHTKGNHRALNGKEWRHG